MIKFSFGLIYSFAVLIGAKQLIGDPQLPSPNPPELTITRFSGPDVTPSPA